jgi:hypothetical protein
MTAPFSAGRSPEFEAALSQASDEHELQDYYRDCVRPLFAMPETQWPRCCGRGCEPCAQTLIAVAKRVKQLLACPEPAKAPVSMTT